MERQPQTLITLHTPRTISIFYTKVQEVYEAGYPRTNKKSSTFSIQAFKELTITVDSIFGESIVTITDERSSSVITIGILMTIIVTEAFVQVCKLFKKLINDSIFNKKITSLVCPANSHKHFAYTRI